MRRPGFRRSIFKYCYLGGHSLITRVILLTLLVVIGGNSDCFCAPELNVPHKPPLPDGSGLSWIQLDGGEWLGGKIISINDELKFKSKNLGVLQLELEKIDRIYTTRELSEINVDQVQLEDFRIVKDGLVRIRDRENFAKENLDTLQSLGKDSRYDTKKWRIKGTVGLNLVKGTTDQIDYNLRAHIQRRDEESRFVAEYLAFIAKEDNVLTEGNRRFSSHYDRFYGESYFFRPIVGSYFTDKFQNIDYRLTLGTGIGYSIIDNHDTEWGVVLGLSYQINQFESVQAGEQTREESPAVNLATDFETTLTSNIDFNLKYNFSLLSSAAGSFQHHLASVLSINISKYLNFDTSFYWDRTQEPVLDENGVSPDQDDFRLVFGVGTRY